MTRHYILFHAVGATEATFFDKDARDNCAQPFIALRQRCAELGYTLDVTRDQPLDECAWIVFWDVISLGNQGPVDRLVSIAKRLLGRHHEFRNVYREALASTSRPGLALIVAEPPSISRKNMRTDVHKNMDVVLTWNESWLRSGGAKYVRSILPVTSQFPEIEKVDFDRKKLLVDISANKFSSHPMELYGKRREAIRYFEQRFPDDFDLYGIGWDGQGKRSFGLRSARDTHVYRSYRGRVSHKWDVLPRYRFAICYENAVFDDYISQRLFDILRCHCVPIYWGAPNIEKYVDPEAFVDRRRFSSNDELADYLASVTRQQYEAMLEAGRRFMKTDRFSRFLGESWGENLLHALGVGESESSRANVIG
jgi:alpha(1,3/1,4) fucosyltransferase